MRTSTGSATPPIRRRLDLCDHPPEPVLCLPDGAADAPPLHTDPVTQSETLTPLIRRTRRSRLFLTLWLLFCFRPTLVKLITQPWVMEQYVVLETGMFLTLLVLLADWAILSLLPKTNSLKRWKRMRRQLADGIPLREGRRDQVPIVVLNWCATTLLLALPILVLLGSAGPFTSCPARRSGPSPMSPWSRPSMGRRTSPWTPPR